MLGGTGINFRGFVLGFPVIGFGVFKFLVMLKQF